MISGRILLLLLFMLEGFAGRGIAQYDFQNIQDPDGFEGTQALAIDGNDIVGDYGHSGANPTHGFLYNGSSYQTIDNPNGSDTVASGIYNGTIVGSFTNSVSQSQGFIDASGTFTTLSGPTGALATEATGISGGTVVGNYKSSGSGSTGFVYRNGSYTTLNDPLGSSQGLGNNTYVTGIDGTNIVGYYIDPDYSDANGFLYNGSTFTTLDDPNSLFGSQGTFVTGISGNLIVGYYYMSGLDPQGFVYNETTGAYTTVDDPSGTEGTRIEGISGNTLVGSYENSEGFIEGFEAVAAPEPSSFSLLLLGSLAGLFWSRKREKKQE
jgi:hypothetical protein